MSKSTAPVVPATAAEVRDFVQALVINGEVTLSEKATHNLNSRGRLHPEVTEAHNSRVTAKRRYVEGATKTVTLDYRRTQPSGRTVAAQAAVTEANLRDLARRAGATVGARGPLSDAAIKAASEQFAREQAASLASA
jgi:hypothetical protein